ncbi:MAG: glycosyltransferase family 2 protein [Opitutae bacterium]|jgi:glycosyltransferase involved in cell wall biosynthesis|nr:glycosyltransferase family 2 protein [Opitutae bacterium]
MSKTLGLSVVIPNHNHSSFLREAVESCLNQTRKADEIILIDDRSTDDSWEIMEDFARRFPPVRIFRNEENEGVVHCMNKGTEKATGDCILFRAADDHLVPDAMFSAKEAFANQPDATIAFGETIFFERDPCNGTKETLALSSTTKFFPRNDLLQEWVPDFNLPSSACFVRKSAVLSVGGFKDEAKWHSDWLCFTTIALRDGLTFIPQPITGFRLNPQSYGNSSLMKQGSQRPVLRYLVNEVMNYEDGLRELFFASGAFAIFGDSIRSLLAEEKGSLPKGSEKLLPNEWERKCFSGKIHRHGISGVVANRLENLMGEISSIENTEGKAAYVYGAGLQTSILLYIWEKLSLPSLSGIIVSQKGDHSDFQGYPVFSLESIAETETYLIVLSSKSFESEMAANLDNSLPSVRRLSFWIKELTKL